MDSNILKSNGNVFNDLGFTREQSGKLAIKSYLMLQIESFIKNRGMTQDQASKMMGVSRPRISDVMRGKIDKFTIDALVDMLTKAGLHVAVSVENAA
ncbi:MAG: XRE family transcriptional regulator [Proteobacteria bacterium]|nr:XRE family transcriptional regulator [Pseudomonadota bacterium]